MASPDALPDPEINKKPTPLIPSEPVSAVNYGILKTMGASDDELRSGRNINSVDDMIQADLNEFLGTIGLEFL